MAVFGVGEEQAVAGVLKVMGKHGWSFGRVAERVLERREQAWSAACSGVRDLRTPEWQGMARNEWRLGDGKENRKGGV